MQNVLVVLNRQVIYSLFSALVSISTCRLLFGAFPFSSPATEAYNVVELSTLVKLSNLCLMGYGFELMSLSGNKTQSPSNK